jgi:hypothetical protein
MLVLKGQNYEIFIYFLNVSVPNEEPKSPVFKTFPQSATVQEGESAKFECEIEKVPQKGKFCSSSAVH